MISRDKVRTFVLPWFGDLATGSQGQICLHSLSLQDAWPEKANYSLAFPTLPAGVTKGHRKAVGGQGFAGALLFASSFFQLSPKVILSPLALPVRFHFAGFSLRVSDYGYLQLGHPPTLADPSQRPECSSRAPSVSDFSNAPGK